MWRDPWRAADRRARETEEASAQASACCDRAQALVAYTVVSATPGLQWPKLALAAWSVVLLVQARGRSFAVVVVAAPVEVSANTTGRYLGTTMQSSSAVQCEPGTRCYKDG